jgi:hypothetical protein
MTTFAWDLPGYLQGHRFSQHSDYYDADEERFKDLAGYGYDNDCWVETGTPVFAGRGTRNREGILLDNTCHLACLPSNPWEGSIVLVLQPANTSTTGSATTFPLQWGTAATATSNGQLAVARIAASNVIRLMTAGSGLSLPLAGAAAGDMVIATFEMRQSTREGKHRKNSVAPTTVAAVAHAATGNQVAIGFSSSSGSGLMDKRLLRIGNINGTYGSTTQDTVNPLYLFEQHFFSSFIISDHATKLDEFLTALRSDYGIP